MQTRTKLWYLENFNLKEILTLEERNMVANSAEMLHFTKRNILYFSKELTNSVFILKEGKVKVYRQAPNGKEIILSIINPGEIFGELGIAGLQEREETAEAMEDSVVYVIDLKKMQALMQAIPSLNTEILKRLGARLKKVHSRLESLICKSAEQGIRL